MGHRVLGVLSFVAIIACLGACSADATLVETASVPEVAPLESPTAARLTGESCPAVPPSGLWPLGAFSSSMIEDIVSPELGNGDPEGSGLLLVEGNQFSKLVGFAGDCSCAIRGSASCRFDEGTGLLTWGSLSSAVSFGSSKSVSVGLGAHNLVLIQNEGSATYTITPTSSANLSVTLNRNGVAGGCARCGGGYRFTAGTVAIQAKFSGSVAIAISGQEQASGRYGFASSSVSFGRNATATVNLDFEVESSPTLQLNLAGKSVDEVNAWLSSTIKNKVLVALSNHYKAKLPEAFDDSLTLVFEPIKSYLSSFCEWLLWSTANRDPAAGLP